MSVLSIVVFHNDVADTAGLDDQDTLVQARAVEAACRKLGHEAVTHPLAGTLADEVRTIARLAPDLVFNLVESVDGEEYKASQVPLMLGVYGLRFTGAGGAAMRLSGDKIRAKERLAMAGLPTPGRYPDESGAFTPGHWIVKSVREHASHGMGPESVVRADTPGDLERAVAALGRPFGKWFAEQFVDGREFNLSVLETGADPRVLPPAEIEFVDFGSRPRIVDYEAKWIEGSHGYENTPRRFDFSAEDAALTERLKECALKCWDVFGFTGYCRVDFRVDEASRPWIIDVNANPCLSPDAGFAAAAGRAGMDYEQCIAEIIRSALQDVPGGTMTDDAACLIWRESVEPGDAERIRALTGATGVFSPEEIEMSGDLAEERMEKGVASGYHFLFALDGAELAGYTCFGPIDYTQGSFDLYWIAVSPGMRRHGLGRTLLERSEEAMRNMGAARIFVDTSSTEAYKAARTFYASCGYALAAELQDFYKPGDSKCIFEKILSV